MTEPSLPELESERERLYAQLSAVGDFRRGSVSEYYRKCGKPNCACARPDHPGHGLRFLWTRTARGRKTVGRQLAAAEVSKVRGELARYAEFAAVSEQIAEVNEKICEARPATGTGAPSAPEGEKGVCAALAREKAAEIGRLAAAAARQIGGDSAGDACGQAEHPLFAAGTGQVAHVLRSDPVGVVLRIDSCCGGVAAGCSGGAGTAAGASRSRRRSAASASNWVFWPPSWA